MAKATKTTEQVQKVIYEDKDVVTVMMSVEEATAVHSALWLIEMAQPNDHYIAFKGVQDALGVALNFPATKLRFNTNDHYNNMSSVYIYSRD